MSCQQDTALRHVDSILEGIVHNKSDKESKPMRGVDHPRLGPDTAYLVRTALYHERLSATTLFLYVGILENKSLVQLVFRPVHLATNNAEQGLAIYQHLDSVLLHHLIKGPGLFDIFQVVRETAASTIPYSNFDEFWLGLV